ncbi:MULTISPECIES: hypothetical protein [Caballeronia]|uniref:hypothetical protein n=1 Tax=Caballeronia TaxID=1827195 RepID=UPI001FD1CEE2|nr:MULTISPECIES: hypothetical protein [Caballeronia]MDR5799167.1 hypothetical protein [Caballeronia sp. LZ001]
MTEKVKDNPAARLYEILKGIHSLAPQSNCRDHWRQLLQTDKEDELLSRLAKLLLLAEDVVIETNRVFPAYLSYMKGVQHQLIDAVSKQNLNGQWDTFLTHVHPQTITHLHFMVTMLNERESMQAPSVTLRDQRISFEEARKQIIEAGDIPDDVKLQMVRHLNLIIASIDEYFITGIFSLMDTLNGAIGNALIDPGYRDAIKGTEAGNKFMKAVFKAAEVAAAAGNIGSFLLSEPVQALVKFITGGGNS